MSERFLAYANQSAVRSNPINGVLYILTYPLSRLATALQISPNSITAVSFFSAIGAFCALLFADITLFALLWAVSFLLDFVDGTVARMSQRVSSFIIDLDHYSDLFKIGLLIIGFGIYFASPQIWLAASVAIFSIMFFSILNHDAGPSLRGLRITNILSRQFRKEGTGASGPRAASPPSNRQGTSLGARLTRTSVTILFTFHAHTLLLFFVIPLGEKIAFLSLLFLAFVSAINVLRIVILSTNHHWTTLEKSVQG